VVNNVVNFVTPGKRIEITTFSSVIKNLEKKVSLAAYINDRKAIPREQMASKMGKPTFALFIISGVKV
jgi:hypothetical protein